VKKIKSQLEVGVRFIEPAIKYQFLSLRGSETTEAISNGDCRALINQSSQWQRN